ncbi:Programmed cell death protein 2 [Fasciola gigantica]|uniref:Programmed cell death protein 2 n=1 Tax=Fasciola gigantica TaxID=46835 RepID=A0A504YXV4_FASGI|nr:Programmed cell death protein 2 [Fasciola gigantica]
MIGTNFLFFDRPHTHPRIQSISHFIMCPGLALGFASPAPAWHLISPLFPDKIGGRPAWLALQHLPEPSELSCPTCSQPMVFLLQVYSTLDERVDCFHRFLFVFMCRNGQCHRVERPHPFVVFRSQLARENAYYSFEPPETEEPTRGQIELLVDSGNLPCAEKFNSICPVCGCLADKACARCKKVRYCSRFHQVIHWRLSHKPLCNPGLPAIVKDGPCFTENEILLPEYKICSEMAEESSEILKESDDDNAADEVDVAQDELYDFSVVANPSGYRTVRRTCRIVRYVGPKDNLNSRLSFTRFRISIRFYLLCVMRITSHSQSRKWRCRHGGISAGGVDSSAGPLRLRTPRALLPSF